MKKFKFLATILILFLILTALAACGGGGEETDEPFVVTFMSDGAVYKTVELTDGAKMPDVPIKTGYIFGGWYTDDVSFANGFVGLSEVTANITVYAKWTKEADKPPVPALSAPTGLQVNGTSLTWTAVEHADGYLIEINGGTPVTNGNSTTYSLASLSPATYSLKVKAVGDGINYSDSAWSNAVTHTYEFNVTVYHNYPDADISEEQPEVKQTVNGKISYLPECDGYAFNGWWFSVGISDGAYLLTTQFNVSQTVENNDLVLYADWVEAKTQQGQLDAPRMTVTNIGVLWDAVTNASSYQLRYFKDGSAEEIVNLPSDQTEWTFPVSSEAGAYTIRLRAIGNGVSTVNSVYSSRNFLHNVLSSPTNIQINGAYTEVTWNSVSDAESYDVYIDGVLFRENLTATRCPLDDLDAGEHTVQVSAKRTDYLSGSAQKTFSKQTLKTPSFGVSYTVSSRKAIYDSVGKITGTVAPSEYWFSQTVTETDGLSYVDMEGEFLSGGLMFGGWYLSSQYANGYVTGEPYDFSQPITGNVSLTPYPVMMYGYTSAIKINQTINVTHNASVKYYAFVPLVSQTIYVNASSVSGNVSISLYSTMRASILDGSQIKTSLITANTGGNAASEGFSYNVTRGEAYYIGVVSDGNTGGCSLSLSGINLSHVSADGGTTTAFSYNQDGNLVVSWTPVSYADAYDISIGGVQLPRTTATSIVITKAIADEARANGGELIITITAFDGDTEYLISDALTLPYRYIVCESFGGTGNIPSIALLNIPVQLNDITKDGYKFKGWYADENYGGGRVTSFTLTEDNMDDEIIFYALFNPIITLEKTIDEAGNVLGAGDYRVGETATITAQTEGGYTWYGWYEGDEKISDNLIYQFTVTDEPRTFTARWEIYNLTLIQTVNGVLSEAGGTLLNVSRAVSADTNCIITATLNAGYTWLGWFIDGIKVSEDDSFDYSFFMPHSNLEIEARYAEYIVETDRYLNGVLSGAGGSVSGAGRVELGASCTVTATLNAGYTWLGWYLNGVKVSEDDGLSYTFTMPDSNVSLEAHWGEYFVTIVSLVNDAQSTAGGSVTGGGRKEADKSNTVTATVYTAYTWLGWFIDDEKVSEDDALSYTFTMPFEDVTLEARWGEYILSLDQNMALAGGKTGNSGRIAAGAPCSVTAITNNYYMFLGWYEGNNKVAATLTYSFDMPSRSLTLTAKWADCPVTLIRTVNDVISAAGGAVSGIETTIVNTQVTITATVNTGYTWLGWYEGDTKISDGNSLSYSFTITEESKTYTAKWGDYGVTLSNTSGGSVSGDVSRIAAGEAFTVTAVTNTGYMFLGWFDGEDNISYDLIYTSTMPHNSVALTAKWVLCPVTPVRTVNDSVSALGGEVSGLETTIVDTSVTVTATLNADYTWLGWYDGASKVSVGTSLSYTFTITEDSRTLTAKYGEYILTVEAETNGAVSTTGGTVSGGGRVEGGTEKQITAVTKAGYTWRGWYVDGTHITDDLITTITMPYSDITYTAVWEDYTLTRISVLDGGASTSGGTVSGNSGKILPGTQCTVTANVYVGYTWLGWYEDGNLVSSNKTYSFEMPYSDVSLEARIASYYISINQNMGQPSVSADFPSDSYRRISVSFNLNGGSGAAPAVQYPTFTQGLTYPTIPEKANSIFAGWYENSAGTGTPFDFSAVPQNSLTLYAKWFSITDPAVTSTAYNGDMSSQNNVTTTDRYIAFVPLVSQTITIRYLMYNSSVWLSNSSKTMIGARQSDFTQDGGTVEVNYSVTAGTLYYISGRGDTYSPGGYFYFRFIGGWTPLPESGGKPDRVLVSAGTDITLTATEQPEFTWLGWYDGDTPLSTEKIFTYTMLGKTVTLTAKWADYSITLERDTEAFGTVSGSSGRTVADTECTVTATTNDGYMFLGWYNGDLKIADTLVYTFDMPYENLILTAKWIPCPVSLEKNIDEAGSVSGVEKTIVGEPATITATVNTGYTWLGWYDGDTKVSDGDSLTYTFTMPEESKTYTAKWEIED